MKFAFSLFASSLALAAAQDLNLYETVAGNEELSTLATAIGLAGFEDYFVNTTDLTVFAPSNSAFETLDAKFLTPGFLPHLKYILQYHVIEGSVVASTDVTDGLTVEMANGENITATVNDQGVFFSGAAFTDSQLLIPDVSASNGIGHVVGGYFLPELMTMDLLMLAGTQEGFGNVMDLIALAGLESEFQADNRTVLAPSNTAFEALDQDFMSELATDTDKLSALLRYHIIIGSYPKDLITDGTEVMTALDQPLTFSVIGGGRFAQISAVGATNNVTVGPIFDLIAANGVAHTIEGVLEAPEGGEPTPTMPVAPTDPTPTAPTSTPPPADPTAPTNPTAPVAPPVSSSATMIGGVVAAAVSVAAAFL